MATFLTRAGDVKHDRHQRMPNFHRTLVRTAIVLLVFLPFVGEVLYGLSLYFGIEAPSGARIIRGGVAALGTIVLLWRPLRPLALYVWSLCGLWLLLLTLWSASSSFMDIMEEFVKFFQLIYGFLFLALIYSTARRGDNLWFLVSTFLALTTSISVLIVFSFVTGIGLYTYGDYTFGTKSFFAVGNGVGFLLLSGFAVACERLLKKFSTMSFFGMAIHFSACIFLGTATSLLGVLLIAVMYFAAYVLFHPSRNANHFISKAIAIVLVGGAMVYGSFKIYQYVTKFPYMVEKAERIVREGPRSMLIQNSLKYFSERPWHDDIFGEGAYSFQRNFYFAHSSKGSFTNIATVEVDPLDLYGSYGIVFSLLVYAPYLFWTYISIKKWLTVKKMYLFTPMLILLNAIGLSFITGHIVFVPTSTTVIAIFVAVLLISDRYDAHGGKKLR